MKKTIFLLVIVSIYNVVNAQLNIGSSGNAIFSGDVSVTQDITTKSNLILNYQSTPYRTILLESSSVEIYSYLDNYPTIPIGSIGLSSHPYNYVHAEEVYATTVYESSDERLKENIEPIQNSIEIIKKMVPVKFDFIQMDIPDVAKEFTNVNDHAKNKVGFIAQDLIEVFPEAVVHDSASDRYYIEYKSIIPLLVDAIKEQNNTIEDLHSEINLLKSQASEKSLLFDDQNPGSNVVLYQNAPNPFTEETVIKYSIPENTVLANPYIILCDMTGKQIRQYQIDQFGDSHITIQGKELIPGMYLYSLIFNSQLFDTKQMILTEYSEGRFN